MGSASVLGELTLEGWRCVASDKRVPNRSRQSLSIVSMVSSTPVR